MLYSFYCINKQQLSNEEKPLWLFASGFFRERRDWIFNVLCVLRAEELKKKVDWWVLYVRTLLQSSKLNQTAGWETFLAYMTRKILMKIQKKIFFIRQISGENVNKVRWWGLNHISYGQRLREVHLFRWKNKRPEVDLITVLKYLMEDYRKRLSQTICRYSEGLGTSFVRQILIAWNEKEVVARASWTGYRAFVFGNNQNSSGTVLRKT